MTHARRRQNAQAATRSLHDYISLVTEAQSHYWTEPYGWFVPLKRSTQRTMRLATRAGIRVTPMHL